MGSPFFVLQLVGLFFAMAAPRNVPPKRPVRLAAGAEYANVSKNTLRRWIAAGQIGGFRRGPKLIFVDLDDLDRMAQRIPTTGQSTGA